MPFAWIQSMSALCCTSPPILEPKPPKPPSSTKRTCLSSTIRASFSGVIMGSEPVKPPMAITAAPVWIMIGAACLAVSVASR